MNKSKKTYSVFQKASAVFMILTLAWLTVSVSFVYSAKQELEKKFPATETGSPLAGNEEESSNPFGNNTEEKVPSGFGSLSEEYIHDLHATEYFYSTRSPYHKCENAGTYIAFHGELLIPPPNAA
jgi:hypothetical protein